VRYLPRSTNDSFVDATSVFGESSDMADYPPRLVYDANDPLPPSAIQSSCVALFLSSALSRFDIGTSRPSALAVVILSTVSYFTDNRS
jgi:hypothetical protein